MSKKGMTLEFMVLLALLLIAAGLIIWAFRGRILGWNDYADGALQCKGLASQVNGKGTCQAEDAECAGRIFKTGCAGAGQVCCVTQGGGAAEESTEPAAPPANMKMCASNSQAGCEDKDGMPKSQWEKYYTTNVRCYYSDTEINAARPYCVYSPVNAPLKAFEKRCGSDSSEQCRSTDSVAKYGVPLRLSTYVPKNKPQVCFYDWALVDAPREVKCVYKSS